MARKPSFLGNRSDKARVSSYSMHAALKIAIASSASWCMACPSRRVVGWRADGAVTKRHASVISPDPTIARAAAMDMRYVSGASDQAKKGEKTIAR